MLSLRALWASVIALSTLCAATSSTGSKVLVVLEPTVAKSDFSVFFNGLEGDSIRVTCSNLTLTCLWRIVAGSQGIRLDLQRSKGGRSAIGGT